MRRYGTKPRWVRLGALALVLALSGAACSDDDDDAADKKQTLEKKAPKTIVVRAGVNDTKDRNIAVTEFLPEKITVAPGTEVTWSWAETIEPHTATFAAGGALPPPGPPDEALFAPTPPAGPFEGTALVNSGLQPLGPAGAPDMKLTFAKAGTFQYYCVIHPLMTGTVEVSDDAAAVDTPAEVADRGDQELEGFLAEGEAAKGALESAEPRKETSAGVTTWFVEMGRTTEHTDILAFAPVSSEVKAGDKVTFVNNSSAPHTASFGDVPQDPSDPAASAPAPGPSPVTLGTSGFFSSGELPPNFPPGAGPPLAARSFTFNAPEAGEYEFVCILHIPSGMAGTIRVG